MANLGILGAGVMGTQLSQFLVNNGHDVLIYDIDEGAMHNAIRGAAEQARCIRLLGHGSAKRVSKNSGRIALADNIKCFEKVEFIFECTSENLGRKLEAYRELSDVCNDSGIIASNTSVIPIAELAAATKMPERVIGLHWMNPIGLSRSVELIVSKLTAAETVARVETFLTGVGKSFIKIPDAPGFISNRLLMIWINEAAHLLDQRLYSADMIDRVCRECFGHAMGPLELADLIGIDTIAASLDELRRYDPQEKYQVAGPLTKMCREQKFGRKTKAGFYLYPL
jgi:3-hydroxybutyryl-CoA dehydrogenase